MSTSYLFYSKIALQPNSYVIKMFVAKILVAKMSTAETLWQKYRTYIYISMNQLHTSNNYF